VLLVRAGRSSSLGHAELRHRSRADAASVVAKIDWRCFGGESIDLGYRTARCRIVGDATDVDYPITGTPFHDARQEANYVVSVRVLRVLRLSSTGMALLEPRPARSAVRVAGTLTVISIPGRTPGVP
jgi:hypothetical protein